MEGTSPTTSHRCGWARACCASSAVPCILLVFVITRTSQLTVLHLTKKNRGSERSENLLCSLYVLPRQARLVLKSTAAPLRCLRGSAALAGSQPVSTLQPSGHLLSYFICGWSAPSSTSHSPLPSPRFSLEPICASSPRGEPCARHLYTTF